GPHVDFAHDHLGVFRPLPAADVLRFGEAIPHERARRVHHATHGDDGVNGIDDEFELVLDHATSPSIAALPGSRRDARTSLPSARGTARATPTPPSCVLLASAP